ncbi:MAG: helix-turn-helix domain-containing protein [Gordonibacter sp.]
MARYVVTLTEQERSELTTIVTRGKGSAALIKHANILLAVDRAEGAALKMLDAQAAAAYHASEQTVRNIKKAFVEQGIDDALRRKKRTRPGNVKIDGATEARIVALTCINPPAGHARWTLRLLAEKSVELGYVDSISHVAIGDVLKKTSLPHGYTRSGAYQHAHANT